MLAYKKPASHVKEITAFLATMHLVGLGGAWLCRLLCLIGVGWSLVVQASLSINPLRRRSGSKGRPVGISVSWALSSVGRALRY